MAEDVTAPEGAKPKRQYQRQRFKKQHTVRIDENVAKAALAKAEGEGWRLTDAMEHGLWLYLKEKRISGVALRGRFLFNELTLEEQKLIESCMALVREPLRSPIEEGLRKYLLEFLWAFRSDPEFEPRLKNLGAPLEAEIEERRPVS